MAATVYGRRSGDNKSTSSSDPSAGRLASIGFFARVSAAYNAPLGPQSTAPDCLKRLVAFDSAEEALLLQLSTAVSVPYDREEPIHERTLKRFFAAVRSPEEASSLNEGKDPRWKELGFQAEDPRTDFRGGGFFALQNMVNLAESYPERTVRMIKEACPVSSSGSGVAEYLFAAACINVSSMLVMMLGLNLTPSMSPVKSMPVPLHAAARKSFAQLCQKRSEELSRSTPEVGIDSASSSVGAEVFGELFSASVFKLHEEWRTICIRKPNATLLDFGDALTTLSLDLEYFLSSLPTPTSQEVADASALSCFLEPLQAIQATSTCSLIYIRYCRLRAGFLEHLCRAFEAAAQLAEELFSWCLCWRKGAAAEL